MPDLQLERALRELGTELAIPVERPLAAAVARRLREEPMHRLGRPLWRRPVVIGLAVLAAALAATFAVEPARTALVELLRIGGVSVERVDRLPEVRADARSGSATASRWRGAKRRSASRCSCRRTTPGRSLPLPCDPRRRGVAALWRRGRAAAARDPVQRQREPDFIKKSAAGTCFSSVLVRGVEGYWLSGAPHSVVFRDEDGVIRTDRYRLAEEVLLWVEDGSFRLEGRSRRSTLRARRIASMNALEPLVPSRCRGSCEQRIVPALGPNPGSARVALSEGGTR